MFPDVTLPLRNKWPHVARRHMEVWRHRLQRRGISLLRLFWVAVGNRDCFGPAVVHSHLSPSFHDPKPTWLSTKLLIKLHEASDESKKIKNRLLHRLVSSGGLTSLLVSSSYGAETGERLCSRVCSHESDAFRLKPYSSHLLVI